MAFRIDRNEYDLRFGHADRSAGLTTQGIDNDLNTDGGGAELRRGGVKRDDIADFDGAFELNAINRDGDKAVPAMTERFDESRLVDQRHDDAAEDGALGVRIAGHHDGSDGWLGAAMDLAGRVLAG